jgi:hypothetical protein
MILRPSVAGIAKIDEGTLRKLMNSGAFLRAGQLGGVAPVAMSKVSGCAIRSSLYDSEGLP